MYNKRGVMDGVQDYYNFNFYPEFKTPDWAKGAVFYQIFTDRFCNGDPTNDVLDREYSYVRLHSEQEKDWQAYPHDMDVCHFYGGDLQGIMHKLDYLQDLGLSLIHIFWKAAAADKDNICLIFDRKTVTLLDILAAFPPCSIEVTAEKTAVSGGGVDNNIDAEDRMKQCTCFAHVFIDRVIVEFAGTDSRITLLAVRIQGHGMVVPDSFTAGNTGNDALSAAAVTGHQMMNGAADADDLAADGQRIDQDSGSIRGCADINKIRGITVVVHNLSLIHI